MMKIKSIFTCFICVTLILGFSVLNYAQDPPVDRAEVPLNDPSKPASVNVTVNHGEITVSGYSGKTILVEAKIDADYSESELLDKVKEKLKEFKKEKSKNIEGMHLVKNNTTGLSVEEENNVVDVKVSFFSKKVDVNIKVPYKTSLKLKGFQAGKIKVENVDGELDVTHHNGPITLNNVSGTVVAHTFNGDLTVSFDRVNLNKPMSFSTFNGDIDVTFPKNAKFNLKMKSDQGEIYSDFKLEMRAAASPEKKSERKDGKYVIKFDKTLYGLLNGGGEEVQFKTFNGNIYIREKK
jgi:DUF4097 and DUF4098 domain-containing protein YvlB